MNVIRTGEHAVVEFTVRDLVRLWWRRVIVLRPFFGTTITLRMRD